MPIEAINALGVGGPEWNIEMPAAPGLDGPSGAPEAGGFGGALADQIENLQGLQTEAAVQSQALATGTAESASDVVMAVERAQLAMQLASTLRDKSLEAFQEIFRTQV